jgi:glycosyltransferase involved in cell wall biosynthesis
MHILIIHQAFASFDEPGGTRHFEFARMLAARGYRVTVIASPVSYITGEKTLIPPVSEKMSRVEIIRARVYSAHHKSFFHRMLAFFSFMFSSFWIGLGVKKVDLVWGTSPPLFQSATAWALARLKGAKFLFEVRVLWPQFAIAVGVLKNPVLIRASEWLERFLYQRADQVMVNSPGFIDHVKQRGARRVELIPNGADPSLFNPSDNGADFRQAYHLDENFVVLYAGAHGMSNDLDVVLESAKLLASESKIQIVLLGDGKEKPALMLRAEQMGLTNITFATSVAKSEMPKALAAADACIAILKPLDEYKTTYPNKVFDYMAAGRPVALAIDGVIREVVETAGCGLFAEPGNAAALAGVIRRLANDPQKSRAMGLKGRKYLEENFSREKIMDELMQVIEQILEKKESSTQL